MEWKDDEIIQRLREYLMIPSVHPDVDYSGCVAFLKQQASQLGLPLVIHEFVAKKPVVVITWTGTQPELPSILLNSHMDVVPVYEEHWTHPPFGAHITDDGWIYARGSLDMKSIGMMHLEAVRKLKNAGVRLKRTVHISFVPDEETGGADGMMQFSKTREFDNLNIGFALDESMPNAEDGRYILFYGERIIPDLGLRSDDVLGAACEIVVKCKGIPGHGSLISEDSAGEKIHKVISKFMKFRAEERRKLDAGAQLGNVTTINLTMLQGGVQVNVLPEDLSVTFDIRIAPDVDLDEFEDMIIKWCAEAGTGVTWEYLAKNPAVASTKIDASNPFYTTLVQTVTDLGKTVSSEICPGATDARFVRARGIPVINFSPLAPNPALLHAHDERLHVNVYMEGVEVMTKVVEAVANV